MKTRLGMFTPGMMDPPNPEGCVSQARWMGQLVRKINGSIGLFYGLVEKAHHPSKTRQHAQGRDAGVDHAQGVSMLVLADWAYREDFFQGFKRVRQISHKGQSCSQGMQRLHDRLRVS